MISNTKICQVAVIGAATFTAVNFAGCKNNDACDKLANLNQGEDDLFSNGIYFEQPGIGAVAFEDASKVEYYWKKEKKTISGTWTGKKNGDKCDITFDFDDSTDDVDLPLDGTYTQPDDDNKDGTLCVTDTKNAKSGKTTSTPNCTAFDPSGWGNPCNGGYSWAAPDVVDWLNQQGEAGQILNFVMTGLADVSWLTGEIFDFIKDGKGQDAVATLEKQEKKLWMSFKGQADKFFQQTKDDWEGWWTGAQNDFNKIKDDYTQNVANKCKSITDCQQKCGPAWNFLCYATCGTQSITDCINAATGAVKDTLDRITKELTRADGVIQNNMQSFTEFMNGIAKDINRQVNILKIFVNKFLMLDKDQCIVALENDYWDNLAHWTSKDGSVRKIPNHYVLRTKKIDGVWYYRLSPSATDGPKGITYPSDWNTWQSKDGKNGWQNAYITYDGSTGSIVQDQATLDKISKDGGFSIVSESKTTLN